MRARSFKDEGENERQKEEGKGKRARETDRDTDHMKSDLSLTCAFPRLLYNTIRLYIE